MREGVKIKLIDNPYLNEKGIIREDCKFKITIPEFKIENSKIPGKPDDKFETMLFLPDGEGRQGEGGLRTKGYFKFSYKLKDDVWHICDLNGNPVMPALEEVQKEIRNYIQSLKIDNPDMDTKQITELPLITVITVVLNGEKYLEETIQSVINQTYPNVEYIIIDGGSTDGTLDIIKKYEDHIDYWVSEKDKGIYDAMNKGVKVALGSWIGFLGSDDFYFDDSLEQYFKFMIEISYKLENYEYISSKINLVKNDKVIRTVGQKWKWQIFRKYMNIAHVGSLHSIDLFKKYGLFDINFKIAGDYEFLLRPRDNLKAMFLNKITAKMNVEGKSNCDYKVFKETELAKIKHTQRNKFLIKIENYYSFLKWKIRKILFY